MRPILKASERSRVATTRPIARTFWRGGERSVKAKTASRGYGGRHQALRRRLAAIVEAGLASCSRCGYPIVPGEPWDVGHDDRDRTIYAGPEHRRCNRATASLRPAHVAPIVSRRFGIRAHR